MIVYYGETLKDNLSESCDIGLKERFIAKDLDNYVHSPNDAMVCCLYGLRRTGKTVMMTQEIRKTEDFDRVLWISCESKDSMWDIRVEVKAHPECKYLYIDEITALEAWDSRQDIAPLHDFLKQQTEKTWGNLIKRKEKIR